MSSRRNPSKARELAAATRAVLRHTPHGKKSQITERAARALGCSRATLYRKMPPDPLKIERLVDQAILKGRLLADQRAWALSFARVDAPSLRSALKSGALPAATPVLLSAREGALLDAFRRAPFATQLEIESKAAASSIEGEAAAKPGDGAPRVGHRSGSPATRRGTGSAKARQRKGRAQTERGAAPITSAARKS
ncbi:hypothetical protein [Piscinibacter koreensis]|uniref:Uncharacterized protein n=1 Tax=Piscinibacter koreensis TaxID=2742824 RepID=A0A7Y6TX49_9BURK|nr:hypothetical protein [Schlegelella koreensis]NUZ06722.1 hypothetical protein [Schlegelella koreensis]